jgi:hypothetical protein
MSVHLLDKTKHMILERTLEFQGSKGEARLQALFDSGATYSCMHADKASALEQLIPLPKPISLETADAEHFVRITHRVTVDFYLNDVRLTDEFMIVPGLSEEVIIGATTMQKWRITLDFEHDEIHVDPRATKLKLM